jgi:hypothetical protein
MNVKRTFLTKKISSAALMVISLSCASFVQAGVEEQAKRIHDRIAGVPPTANVLALMVTELNGAGGGVAAARIAMDNADNSSFYN